MLFIIENIFVKIDKCHYNLKRKHGITKGIIQDTMLRRKNMLELSVIRDTVMNVAEAITAALEIETEIINEHLEIIGGTGPVYA